jgi:hypothetical protein
MGASRLFLTVLLVAWASVAVKPTLYFGLARTVVKDLVTKLAAARASTSGGSASPEAAPESAAAPRAMAPTPAAAVPAQQASRDVSATFP